MLVIALDTSTPSVTAGLVDCDEAGVRSLSEVVTVNPRAHGELLMPHLVDVLAAAGHGLHEISATVVGCGPGPFTGLRVGMATAAALGHAHAMPVHSVCGLDAIAAEAATRTGLQGALLVAADARRGEVYWSVYGPDGARRTGPHVDHPEDVASRIEGMGVRAAAGELASRFDVDALSPGHPTPFGLASMARDALLAGAPPQPLVPLYLRRPDAATPGPPKPVMTRGGR